MTIGTYIELPAIDRAALAEQIERLAMISDESYSPNTLGVYKPPGGEALLHAMRATVQRYVQTQLYLCNSFGRVASNGAELREHTDRPGLDWTVTIMVERDMPWPLEVWDVGRWVAYDSSTAGILMKSGVLPHRRPPYQGERCVQLFLHYTEDPDRQNDA